MTDEEPFKLENPKPVVRPAKAEDDSATQLAMFAGLDCLPGQLDLFTTDGELSNGSNDQTV